VVYLQREAHRRELFLEYAHMSMMVNEEK